MHDTIDVQVLATGLQFPEGPVALDDGSVLVAEIRSGLIKRVWVFDIDRPGKLHKATGHGAHGGRLLCALPGYQRLDSLAIDSAGNICVGTLVTGMITVISPRGEILRQVKFPDSYVTNICFGGADMRTAYVTLSETGRLVATRWDIPGLRLNFNA